MTSLSSLLSACLLLLFDEILMNLKEKLKFFSRTNYLRFFKKKHFLN